MISSWTRSRRAAASRRPPVVAVVMATVMAVALVACGGDSDGTTNASLQGLSRPEPLNVADAPAPTDMTVGHDPAPFQLRAAPNELLIVYFGYTSCPDVCPATLSYVSQAVDKLGPLAARVKVAMITVDPERDTPEILSGYLSHFFESNYHALRAADPAELAEVEARFLASSALTPRPDGGYDVAHSGSTYIVDENAKVVVEWPFGFEIGPMEADLRLLLTKGTSA